MSHRLHKKSKNRVLFTILLAVVSFQSFALIYVVIASIGANISLTALISHRAPASVSVSISLQCSRTTTHRVRSIVHSCIN